MASPIEIMIGNMNRLGFFDFMLPWILFLAITFALLKKSEALSKEVSVNAVVAAVFSFFIINYTPVGMSLSQFFTNLFALASIVISGLLVGILFLGMAGLKLDEFLGKESKTAIGAFLAFLAIIVFISVGGMSFFDISSDLAMTIAMVFVMLLVVLFIAKGDAPAK